MHELISLIIMVPASSGGGGGGACSALDGIKIGNKVNTHLKNMGLRDFTSVELGITIQHTTPSAKNILDFGVSPVFNSGSCFKEPSPPKVWDTEGLVMRVDHFEPQSGGCLVFKSKPENTLLRP